MKEDGVHVEQYPRPSAAWLSHQPTYANPDCYSLQIKNSFITDTTCHTNDDFAPNEQTGFKPGVITESNITKNMRCERLERCAVPDHALK